jgi:hypothetical protein
MSQAYSFYEGHSLYQGLTWGFIRERIGHALRERYEVPKELPPGLLPLVGKQDDNDWLFGSASRQNDRDLLFG